MRARRAPYPPGQALRYFSVQMAAEYIITVNFNKFTCFFFCLSRYDVTMANNSKDEVEEQQVIYLRRSLLTAGCHQRTFAGDSQLKYNDGVGTNKINN